MRDLNYQLKQLCARNRDVTDQKGTAVAATLCMTAHNGRSGGSTEARSYLNLAISASRREVFYRIDYA